VSSLFELQASRICSALLILVYSLAVLIVFTLPVMALAKVALAMLLVGALVYYLRRIAWLLSASSPVAMRIQGANITLLTRAGEELSGELMADTLVTPILIVINVIPQGSKKISSVLVFPDSMDKERSRELRVLLKWGG